MKQNFYHPAIFCTVILAFAGSAYAVLPPEIRAQFPADLPADYFTDSIPYTPRSAQSRAVCVKGKPCGNTCISLSYTCRIGTTTTPISTYTPTPIPVSTPVPVPIPTPIFLIDQAIIFGASPPIQVGASGILTATGGASGNAVLFSSITPSICTATNSGTVTGITAGICTITATQAGNFSYNAATQVAKSFSINAAPTPTVAIKPPPATCANIAVKMVLDGDTISIANEYGKTEKIRLSQIDAPEKSQPYGVEATTCLANLLAKASVSVCRDGMDQYGRTIATVKANGADVAYPMVSQGCAWAYSQYLESGSALPSLQQQAQAQNVGLWAAGTASVQAPWLYRAGTQPVPLNPTTAKTPIVVTATTTATTYNRIFDWAEQAFSDLLIGAVKNNTNPDGTVYRCYSSRFCIGYRDGRVLTFDGIQLKDIAGEADILPMVQAGGF